MADLNQKFDYFKHLSTICTGSILLIVTFQDKLYRVNQAAQGCIPISIIAFLICLSCTFGVYTLMVFKNNHSNSSSDSKPKVSYRVISLGFLMFISLTSFATGVGSLVFYVLYNFGQKPSG